MSSRLQREHMHLIIIIINGATKVGEISQRTSGKEVEVECACDETRGAAPRGGGDGNESTREKEGLREDGSRTG